MRCHVRSAAPTPTPFVSATILSKLTASRVRSGLRLSLPLSPRGSCSPRLREQQPFASARRRPSPWRASRGSPSPRGPRRPPPPEQRYQLAPGGDDYFVAFLGGLENRPGIYSYFSGADELH